MKALITLGIVAGIIGFGFMMWSGIYNQANSYEKTIVAKHESLKNILAQYQNKIIEMVQVPEMYKEDVKEVITAAVQGRYGQDGSKAVFQMLKEQNPSLDVSVYAKIQNTIEAGRDRFTNEQNVFIDQKRGYETVLGTFVTGSIMKLQGWPKITLADYKIVTNEQTEESFKTGIDKPMKLR